MHFIIVLLPLLAAAHDLRALHRDGHHLARQAPPPASSSSPASPPTSPPASPPPASTPAPPASTPAPSQPAAAPPGATPAPSAPAGGAPPPGGTAPASLPPQVPVTLRSMNPTAIPLSSITANQATTATIPLASTPTAGAVCTHIPNCPPLPDISALNPANYPPLDKTPPTDSPQVQQWIADVRNSGITIPNLSATVAGGCPANTGILADDANRCWWTCTGCVRDDDVQVCPDKLTWGLTYDDGPAFYTPNLMSYLSEVNLKATFFDVGSRVISNPNTARLEHIQGHQLGVHTWAHPALTTLTNDQIIAELGWTKKVIEDVTGVTPLFFRPPYGDIDDRVRAIAKAMNLAPVMWTRISPQATFDTGDFDVHGGIQSSSQVINNFQHILNNATVMNTGFIVLEHDLFLESVELATGYIIPEALAFRPQLKIEPVITCTKKEFGSSYLQTNNNRTNPLPSASNAVGTGTFTAGAAATGSTQGGSGGALANNAGIAGTLLATSFALLAALTL